MLAAKSNKKIGVVTYWFNRGQATVSRYIRTIFDSHGYGTAVLARPTMDKFFLPGFIDDSDVWAQPGVTWASSYDIPDGEYYSWVKKENVEVVFFDQNYQFDAIARLKKIGIKTIGRFVWEAFSEKDVKPAKKAFSIIYSLTKCEQERYKLFGINSPLLRWGCHPELFSVDVDKRCDAIYLFYPAGYLSARKPTGAVIKALEGISEPSIRVIIKTQRPLRESDLITPIHGEDVRAKRTKMRRQDSGREEDKIVADPRVLVVTGDMAAMDYYSLFKSCHVCICPSRWEGLGLHLYEAIAFKMPIVANNIPPINEVVTSGLNGLLAKSFSVGHAQSGIVSYEPDVESLRSSIEQVIETTCRSRMERSAEELSKTKFSWENTRKDFEQLITL